jgi:hypothetical protein
MKKRQLLLTLLLLFSTNYILAQQLSPVIPKNFQSLKKKSLNDTIKRNYPNAINLLRPYTNKNRMPVLITGNSGVYKQNLGNGFDLYTMNIDKMPCISPDSTFKSNMTVTQFLRDQKTLTPISGN